MWKTIHQRLYFASWIILTESKLQMPFFIIHTVILRKYGWACPSCNMIRIQSDRTVSNIHKSASDSRRIAENHNAYTGLTRFRAESFYWMAFVLYIYLRTTQHALCLSFRFHCSHINWLHIDRLILKITIHLSNAYWYSVFFLSFPLFSPRFLSPKCHSALHTYIRSAFFSFLCREKDR